MPDLQLASTSPRRSELLRTAGIAFAACVPGEEEVAGEVGTPAELAVQRARRKALGAAVTEPSLPVLGVDTVVDLEGRELGKARDRGEALAMLRALAGRRHRVHTAHCLYRAADGRVVEELSSAVVQCRAPEPDELERYLDSQQWQGKAGSYGIQDPAQSFLTLVEGPFDAVVGLHVDAVRRLLAAMGEP